MTADPGTELVDALERFFREARQVVDEELNRSGSQQPVPQALAQSLAQLPTCLEADAAARQAAAANGYLVPVHGPQRVGKRGAEPLGRPLDADALISTGIVGTLLAHADLDLKAVARDLAGYLAGPSVGVWDYAILDASLMTHDPIPVARQLVGDRRPACGSAGTRHRARAAPSESAQHYSAAIVPAVR